MPITPSEDRIHPVPVDAGKPAQAGKLMEEAEFRLSASLDGGGRIATWRQDVWSNGFMGRPTMGGDPRLLALTHLAGGRPMPPAPDLQPANWMGASRNSVPGAQAGRCASRSGSTARESPRRAGTATRSSGSPTPRRSWCALWTRPARPRSARARSPNSHLGGALPMLLQRADDQYRWEAPGTPELPSVAARRMWYDTVGHGHVPALRCAIDSFGADRLLLGTDFPYENGDIFVRAVDYVSDPQIDTGAARAILDQNASALLGTG